MWGRAPAYSRPALREPRVTLAQHPYGVSGAFCGTRGYRAVPKAVPPHVATARGRRRFGRRPACPPRGRAAGRAAPSDMPRSAFILNERLRGDPRMLGAAISACGSCAYARTRGPIRAMARMRRATYAMQRPSGPQEPPAGNRGRTICAPALSGCIWRGQIWRFRTSAARRPGPALGRPPRRLFWAPHPPRRWPAPGPGKRRTALSIPWPP